MKRLVVPAMVLIASCGGGDPISTPGDPLSGGMTSVFDVSASAYGNRAANLADEHNDAFSLGHALFERNWVTAPATTSDIDGLGPLFNQRSCSACHAHDGRAAPFAADGSTLNLLIRLSDTNGGPDPVYGTQWRTHGILGVPGDGDVSVSYTEVSGTYGDGTRYALRSPTYALTNPAYGAPLASLQLSPRVGPILVGLGLLEAISETDIAATADAGDPDGVFGVANGGRFGWKGDVPSVRTQVGRALQSDMGLTSRLAPTETCSATMTACLDAPNGGAPEVSDAQLDAIALYMETLAVPARRDVDDPTVMRGETLFADFRCTACHVATFTTAGDAALPEARGQTIHPYSDLLVHDMGDAQWRTPPLWGIGLLERVNDHQLLLHDGRARGFAEAILWHGGEGEAARERFRNAKATDRDALIAFLMSL